MTEKTNNLSKWMEIAIQDFRESLQLSKSKSTVSAYKTHVETFLKWCYSKRIRKLENIREKQVTQFLQDLGLTKKDSTVFASYMSLRSFYNFLHKSKQVKENIMKQIETPKVKKKPKSVPEIDAIEKILAQPDLKTQAGLRDRAIMELLYSSGLRISELCALKFENVTQNSVTIESGKGNRTRTIPIGSQAHEFISRYIDTYRGRDGGILFQNFYKQKISRVHLYRLICEYAKQAGIDNFTPHSFRHSCATHFLEEGADIHFVQKILGHSTITTTERYAHLSSKSMLKKFEEYNPRREKND